MGGLTRGGLAALVLTLAASGAAAQTPPEIPALNHDALRPGPVGEDLGNVCRAAVAFHGQVPFAGVTAERVEGPEVITRHDAPGSGIERYRCRLDWQVVRLEPVGELAPGRAPTADDRYIFEMFRDTIRIHQMGDPATTHFTIYVVE